MRFVRIHTLVRDLEAKVDLLLERQHQVMALLNAMSKQQNLPFKRQKNPAKVAAGKRIYAERKEREQRQRLEAEAANGSLGLADGPART